MHLLLIIALVMAAFPWFSRLVGSILSAVFWIVAVLAVFALIGALSH